MTHVPLHCAAALQVCLPDKPTNARRLEWNPRLRPWLALAVTAIAKTKPLVPSLGQVRRPPVRSVARCVAVPEGRNCPSCGRPRRVCLCDALPEGPMDTRTQVVLFTHPKEVKRSLGTAPLLQLCLKRTIKLVGKVFPDPEENPSLHEQLRLGGRQCFLLYPGPTAVQVAEISTSPVPKTLILIDARWEQSRIMLNRSDWLQNLPRITLGTQQQSRYIWRRQPAPGCISTLEAAAEALHFLEGQGALSAPGAPSDIKSALLAPFEKMVQLQCQFTPDARDKNADLQQLGGLANENANPLWNRRRKWKRRRRQGTGSSLAP